MATVNATSAAGADDGSVMVVTWTPLTTTNQTGSALQLPRNADKTVTITGTWGVGGSVTLQGSNDGTTWLSLTDPQGNAITKTADGIEAITENPLYIRPNCTAGDGTTSIKVIVAARLANPLRT